MSAPLCQPRLGLAAFSVPRTGATKIRFPVRLKYYGSVYVLIF